MNNARLAVLIAVVFASVIGAAHSANADTATALAPTIEQCIRDNAAKVEATIPDLNEAVLFLVGSVCAEPVANENQRQNSLRMERYSAHWKQMCDAQKSAAKSEPLDRETRKPAYDACAMLDYKVGFLTEPDDIDATAYVVGLSPPSALALASHLLLDLRLAHSQSGHSH